jgi:hypothetical protein
VTACHDLSVHIAFLFTSLLVHDVVPRDLSLNSVIPIPKGKNVLQRYHLKFNTHQDF